MQPPERETPVACPEQSRGATPEPDGATRGRLVAGLSWAAAYQAFELLVSLGSMLITVRLIAPGDYGRAAAVVGVMAALNTFACGLFVSHALQLPEGVEPDWTLHFSASAYVQGALFLACEAIACAAWFSPVYSNVAVLLHVAGVGLLAMAINQVAITRLYRELNFARMKTLSGVTTVAKLSCTIGFALAGHGAFGIVCANNLVCAIPFGFDLIVIRGWRPRPGWWRWPDWRAYADPLRFGTQRLAVAVVGGIRDGLEASVLPGSLGFAAMGLAGRASGLYSATVGRLETIVLETIYPFLPRASGDSARYSRRAMLLTQAALFTMVPAACFIALEGSSLSRLLYGGKWIAADPLILPATVAGAGLTISSLAGTLLLGAGRVRRAVHVDVIVAILWAAALGGALYGRAASPYVWSLAAASVIAATISATLMSSVLPHGWLWRSLAPAAVSGAIGAVVLRTVHVVLPQTPLWHVPIAAALFGLTTLATVRMAFTSTLVALFDDLNWTSWPRRILWLPDPATESAAAA